MSVQSAVKRKTAPDILKRKGGDPIVMLTAYHAHTARLVDKYCDVILVGDSLGNVMHGFETTVPVTLDMMILQGHAVMRGSQEALVVVDMPFGSYEASKEQAFHSAVRIMKETHCGAVKMEGGVRMAETIEFLTTRGIPVMGHIGLTPQSINTLGSFKSQGKDRGGRERQRAVSGRRARGGASGGILDCGGSCSRAAGTPHHGDRVGADDRYRRQQCLRRPGSGTGRYAGPVSVGAEIRQALRQSRAGHRSSDSGLREGSTLARVSGAGACLRHQAEGLTNR